MPCMQCPDGSVECGPDPKELCQTQRQPTSFHWEDAGVFAFHLYIAHGDGRAKVRVVPCIPQEGAECRPLRPPRGEAR